MAKALTAKRAEFYSGLSDAEPVSEGERRVLDALRLASELPYYWLEGDVGSVRSQEDVLAVHFEHPTWWQHHIVVDQQVHLRLLGDFPDAVPRRIDWTKWLDDLTSVGSRWWSLPLASGVPMTSTQTRSGLCVGLLAGEDDLGADKAELRPVTIAPEAASRVFEITTKEDWRQLVEAFPADASPGRSWAWGRAVPATKWWLPDWPRVARDYAGVRLSPDGFLDISGVPIALDDGYTMLAGWDPDTTVWLRMDALRFDRGMRRVSKSQLEWTLVP